MHAPAPELDEEEDVESSQCHRVHCKKVTREHALSLAAEELTPAEPAALAGRAEAGFAQELAHGGGRELFPRPAISPAIRL